MAIQPIVDLTHGTKINYAVAAVLSSALLSTSKQGLFTVQIVQKWIIGCAATALMHVSTQPLLACYKVGSMCQELS